MTTDGQERKYARLLRAVMILCFVALTIFFVDYLVLRMRHSQFGSVTVHRFYRIPQKNGKLEIQYDGDYTYNCSRSLFPHSASKPCWYLNRKTEEWIDINSGTANNPHIF